MERRASPVESSGRLPSARMQEATLSCVRSTRNMAIPTKRKSGQRNYVTLRKRASIASVSNVSATRSVNERKKQRKTIMREKEVRILIIHMSAVSLGGRSIHWERKKERLDVVVGGCKREKKLQRSKPSTCLSERFGIFRLALQRRGYSFSS